MILRELSNAIGVSGDECAVRQIVQYGPEATTTGCPVVCGGAAMAQRLRMPAVSIACL